MSDLIGIAQERKGEPMRLIDANELKKKKKHSYKEFFENVVSVADIDNAPTIDVVQCKDCKYYNPIGVCIEMNCAVCEDSFCCWAERKENG